MKRLANPYLFGAVVVATIVSFALPDADSFRVPSLARIIFWHLPCAFLTTGLVFLAAWFGLRYLGSRDTRWDIRGAAALELGALFGALTMVTGILFSKVQWGEWWQNDPRQTSFLMVLLILAAGLSLRAGLSDEKKAASAGAGYALFSLIPNFFLMFVFPRLPQVRQRSFHPSETIQTGGFDGAYWTGILVVFACLAWVTFIVYRLRVEAGELTVRAEFADGNREADRGSAAPDRMVRPVPVPPGGGD
ncbi:MAG TPA: cytochrome c biogenesis protein CcsA [Fimbriimonadaceae bacterium]|nr:cytochrome c biogenesis protein CcsA [Fimbriimonadaceae bacterium]HRJ95509.1 cytochrome c biogenesis protein CcsA [Fimbriimonadaceae bacterium]